MTKTHYGPEVPELGDLARSVGGWRRLSEMAETNAGTLASMAKGRRRLTRRVRQVLTDHGARPAGMARDGRRHRGLGRTAAAPEAVD